MHIRGRRERERANIAEREESTHRLRDRGCQLTPVVFVPLTRGLSWILPAKRRDAEQSRSDWGLETHDCTESGSHLRYLRKVRAPNLKSTTVAQYTRRPNSYALCIVTVGTVQAEHEAV